MMDADTIRFIREEIRRQCNIILSGAAGTNTSQLEDVQSMFPGMSTITQRPVMHPYGLASRATAGTIQVVARQGDHFANRIVLGHRDSNRPDVENGETILYDAYGHVVYLSQNKIQIGSKSAAEPFVLGNVFKQFEETVLQAIADHTHVGNLGSPTGVPINAAVFTGQKSSPIGDKAILSDKIMGEK